MRCSEALLQPQVRLRHTPGADTERRKASGTAAVPNAGCWHNESVEGRSTLT
jgi:hypothetical protein